MHQIVQYPKISTRKWCQEVIAWLLKRFVGQESQYDEKIANQSKQYDDAEDASYEMF